MPYVRPEIEAMAPYVPGEQPQHGKLIKLNTNESPYPPPAAVARAIAEAASTLPRYPDPRATAFRRRAGEILGFDPEWILCGNGSDDILTVVTRAMVGQGQLLRFPYPSYILYATLAEIQGARFEHLAFQPDWSLPPEFGARADGLRLVFLPNPNSPSGTLVPPDAVGRLASRLDCPLLVDEAYVDFADTHCLDLVRTHANVMVSRTLSKSYALAGLRFGFLVARPEIIEQLNKVKDSYNCDTLSIAAATAAIDDQAWLADNVRRVTATRERLVAGLRQLEFSVVPSQANFVWSTHAERPVQPVYERLKSEGILVRYMNYPPWGDGLRVSVGTDEQTDAFLRVLESILQQ